MAWIRCSTPPAGRGRHHPAPRARTVTWTRSSRRSRESSRTSRLRLSSIPDQTSFRQNLLLVDTDHYTAERVRLALGEQWVVHRSGMDGAASLSARLAPRPVIMIPFDRLSEVPALQFPVPVLGYGPPSLFDLVPPGLCDDLIAEPWAAAELRYRLGRLILRTVTVAGTHAFSWSPTCMTAGGRTVPLSRAEHGILDLLVRAGGEWVPREALAAVAGVEPSGRALDMRVSRLRMKLRSLTAGWPRCPQLVAQRSFGYALRW